MMQVCINHRKDDKLGIVFFDFVDVSTNKLVGSLVINYWEKRCFITDINYKPDLPSMTVLSGVKNGSLAEDRMKDVYYSINDQLSQIKAQLQFDYTQFKQYMLGLLRNE